MAFALAVPAMAYDWIDPYDSWQADQWTVSSVYHWVVRGETLQTIADLHGTTVDNIKSQPNNVAYFADLALRNTTTGLNIQVEHGVRLKIYDQVTLRRYVRRDDTFAKLTNYSGPGGFTLVTTEAAIRAQNPTWFADLAKLNNTQGTSYVLMESNNIFANYADFWTRRADTSSTAASPLYITVPITVTSWVLGPYNRRDELQYAGEDFERTTNLDVRQIPFAFPHLTSGLVTPKGWTDGFLVHSRDWVGGWPSVESSTISIAAARAGDTGPYNKGGSNGNGAAAGQVWHTVSERSSATRSSAQILADIARQYDTTVAAIRELNAEYFARINAAGVGLEYNVAIRVK
ncbi:MAG: LysM peptidoglycan-binding domain-containing protein [Oscillospiraceae bacterium]|nr:LysM peptidoglycan-binding domain-containing protein [Oscillospiraceae bacterium]